MTLSAAEASARLAAHDHGVLCTLHPERGVDAVPVVYVVRAGHLGVPIDLVKPKRSPRLQRERNLEADPRATLLIDHWDPVDWSRLWWVRSELVWVGADPDTDVVATLSSGLGERFPQYRGQPFARVLVFRLAALTGWSGGGGVEARRWS